MQSTSRRRLTIIVNSTLYEVELGDLTASPIVVYVNGKPYNVTVETTADALPSGPRVTAVEPAEPSLREERSPSQPRRPQEAGGAGREAAQVVRAPMPGNILDIAVAAGDQVAFRDRLCALEAMKMKTAIQSPRSGTIASVEVVEGQVVAHGDVLFTFA